MRLPIIDNRIVPTQLDLLVLQRIGGIAGVHERVEITNSLNGLTAHVTPFMSLPRQVDVDAAQAGELVSAVRRLIERQPAPLARSGPDRYRYVLEVVWQGKAHRFEIDGEPEDDALHGVVYLASTLLATNHPGFSNTTSRVVEARPANNN